MLSELHVKNLALIEKADIEFGSGLNILTGETGAGKSIIIGSVTMALGQKASKDLIREGEEAAYAELLFSVTDPDKLCALKKMEVFPDESGTIIISRRITQSRSICRINDETVTVGKLKEVTGLLIDIHGQHEHQSLLYRHKHLEILDKFHQRKSSGIKQEVTAFYRSYIELKERLESFQMDEEARLREMDFLLFEIGEIEGAAIREGEEEELTDRFRLFSNARKITESLSAAYEAVNNDGLGHALKEVEHVASYDERLSSIRDQMADADGILSDISRDISLYMEDMAFDGEELKEMETRLDLIHGLEAKYGRTAVLIQESLEEKRQKLLELQDYDALKEKTKKELSSCEERLDELCGRLSGIRKEAAKELSKKIRTGLLELNFLNVEFTMDFKRLDHFTAEGYDEAEFMISTNPGESPKPLGMVASGGELSRVMLAIKTVLADSDDIPTLIFDEIDTGISGRTAQMVSEKLSYIAESHQVICITHLPQIAAMADAHYEIAKKAEGGRTATTIRALAAEEVTEELARLLGGAKITQAVRENAREMKRLAAERKKASKK